MPAVAGSILDDVGWRATADLTDARLLEPAAGDGAFLVPAAKRLVASFRSRGIEPTIARLRPRITAFELHPGAASEARSRVRTALREMRLHHGPPPRAPTRGFATPTSCCPSKRCRITPTPSATRPTCAGPEYPHA